MLRMPAIYHPDRLVEAIWPLNRHRAGRGCGLHGESFGSIGTGRPPRLPNNLLQLPSRRKARNGLCQAADGEPQSNVREKKNHGQYRQSWRDPFGVAQPATGQFPFLSNISGGSAAVAPLPAAFLNQPCKSAAL